MATTIAEGKAIICEPWERATLNLIRIAETVEGVPPKDILVTVWFGFGGAVNVGHRNVNGRELHKFAEDGRYGGKERRTRNQAAKFGARR